MKVSEAIDELEESLKGSGLDCDALKGLLEDALFSQESRCRQFLNIEFMQHIYQQHCQANKLYNRHLWVLLVFEMWCRRYGIAA